MAAMFRSLPPQESPPAPSGSASDTADRHQKMLSVLDLHRTAAQPEPPPSPQTTPPAPAPAPPAMDIPPVDPDALAKLATEQAGLTVRTLTAAGDACVHTRKLAEAIELYSLSLDLQPDPALAQRRDDIFAEALKTGHFDLPRLFTTMSEWAHRQDLDSAKLRLLSEFLNRFFCPGRALEFAARSLQVALAQPGHHPDEDYRQLDMIEQRLGELARATQGIPHVLFYSLSNAGVSAIHPILREILKEQYAYDDYNNPDLSDRMKAFADGPTPFMLWTHYPQDRFPELIARPDFKILVLFRDPRDVLISHMKQLYVDHRFPENLPEKEALRGMIPNVATWFAATTEWLKLPPSRRFAFSFEEMKKDVPRMVQRILDFLGLPVDEQTVRTKCDHWSYETQSKRQRGEEGKTIHSLYMFRKGISGDWKNYFDDELTALFQKHCGQYLPLWGYQ